MGSRLLRKRDKDKDKDKEKAKAKEKMEKDEEKEKVIERVREREKERKKEIEKARENEKTKAKGKEDDRCTTMGSMSSKDSKKPKLALVFSNPSTASASPDPNLRDHWLTQPIRGAAASDSFQNTPAPIRHARSQSNLQRGSSKGEETIGEGLSSSSLWTRETTNASEAAVMDAAAGTSAGAGGSGGKKRMRIVKGVSVQAEKLARGLDSALDFVDGRVGFGTP
jgi:hypothetical protein